MKKDMPLEGLRWSRDSGSALYDTPPKRPFSDGLGGHGRKHLPSLPVVMAQQTTLIRYPQLQNWRGSATR